VCIGPGPLDCVRRIEDRGPLHPDRRRANAIAAFLRSTGLYESVTVVGSTVKAAMVGSPDTATNPRDVPAQASEAQALDDLAALLDESPGTEAPLAAG